MRLILVLAACMMCIMSGAQRAESWQDVWQSTIDDEEDFSEETFDWLQELAERPINLNRATREELERLPFLSPLQVMDLLEARDRFGAFFTLNELKTVRSLDYRQLALLPYFVTAGEWDSPADSISFLEKLRNGQHKLTMTGRVPFYQRKGNRNGYMGYRYRHWLKYEFSYHERQSHGAYHPEARETPVFRLGMVAAQDAGEPFFSSHNRWGYDAYSYYVEVEKLRRVKYAVVGKYKLSAGMGLVLNNSISLGKQALLSTMGRQGSSIRAHRSRTEANSFQGIATTVSLSRKMEVSLFASYKPVDATLNQDGQAQTIVTTGYHRTPAEMAKKHNTRETDAGLRMVYRYQGLHAGLNTVYTHLNRELSPLSSSLYRRYYPRGYDFLNTSLDYGLTLHHVAFSGETAMDRYGHVATVHAFNCQPLEGLSLTALHRFYSYRYTSMHGRAFSEGSRVQNEQGFFVGAVWRTGQRWQVTGYADFASFPWARYRVSKPSTTRDYLLETSCRLHRQWTLTARYRWHQKQQDDSLKKALIPIDEHKGRLILAWSGTQWGAKTQLDLSHVVAETAETGWMLSQRLDWTGGQWQASGMAGYFHTSSYASRVYVFERQLPGEFSFPSYFGRGFQLSLLIRANIGRCLQLGAKLGFIRYNDRETIGSGLQEIDHPWQTDLDLQARIKI